MRAFTAVFLREIEEHRLVFLIGGFLALISLLAPFLVPTSHSARDVREVTAMALSLAYALILSIGLGMTGIASELGSDRHGFFFARPVGAGSLLGGKLAAAFVLVAGGSLLAVAPAATQLAEIASDWHGGTGTRGLGVSEGTFIAASAIGTILLVLGCAHFLSLAVRARDAWLAVDLTWLATLAALGFWSYAQLEAIFASGLWIGIFLAPFIFLLMPAVVVAWLLQVARGRTDLSRSHRWMSAALGCMALAIGAWLAISAYQAARPEPTDLFALHRVQAGSGGWLFLKGMTGSSLRYQPSFFWNTTTGSYVRVHSARSVTFNKDLSKAIWFGRSDPRTQDRDFYWIDLSTSDPLPVKSPATIRVATKFLSVSPTGSRAALWGGNQLSVIDVASGVPILTRTIEKGPLLGVVFLDRQTVQLLRHQKHGANEKVFLVDTIDLETSETSAIITAPLPRSNWFHWFTENQRLTCGSTLLDLATGERIADLAPGIPRKESGRYSHKFLSDGRIIGYKPFGKSGSLFLYDRDGNSLRRFELGPAQYVSVGGQPSREELLVSMNTGGDRSHGSWTTYALNLKDGSSRNLGPMLPISRAEEQPGSRSTSLFTDASHSLFELEEDGSFRQWTRGRISHGFWPGLGLPEVF